jgi:hypothetical protein
LARRRWHGHRLPGTGRDGGKVAVKIIRWELAADEQFRRRFYREADHARRVRRHFIAPVLDVGTEGTRPYLVTEYIEGPTVQEHVKAHRAMRPVQVERLGYDVASALSVIEAAGLIHRDLKPSNVVLGGVTAGTRVIDFGISRALDDSGGLTSPLVLFGTPEFMAPEQFDDQAEVTPATDVFAWGGLMVFAGTGRPPFGSRSTGGVDALAARVREGRPDLDRLDPPMRQLVQDAMTQDPEARPSARELVDRLGPGDQRNLGGPRTTRAEADSRRPSKAATVTLNVSSSPGFPNPVDLSAPRGTPSPPTGGGGGTGVLDADEPPSGLPFTGLRAARPRWRLRLVPVLLLAVAVALFGTWLLPGIAANAAVLAVFVVEILVGIILLAIGVVGLATSEHYRPQWAAGLVVVALGLVFFLPASHGQLTNQYWVGLDGGSVAVLKGAGPDGFLGVHHVSGIEQSSTRREYLPALVSAALEKGIPAANRARALELRECLPLLLTPAADLAVGPDAARAECADQLFDVGYRAPMPPDLVLPDTALGGPVLAATAGRVTVAWTSRTDTRVYVRSTSDGRNFSQPERVPAFSGDEPALATDGSSSVYVAWRDPSGRLAVATSEDGTHFGDPVWLGRSSPTAPALAYGDGRVVLAWVGDNNRLHVLPSASVEPIRFDAAQEVILEETSRVAPSLLFADQTWHLSWVGTDGQVNLLPSADLVNFPATRTLSPHSEHRPALAVQAVWLLAWTRSDAGGIGLLISKTGSPTFVNELSLGASSDSGVAMTTFRGQVFLAWTDNNAQRVHIAALI